jgi:hypothetical protein
MSRMGGVSGLLLPPEDWELSPHTGWTREHWAAVADQLLLALRPYFSASRARVLPPGRSSAYGTDSDGLEGFARSFLLFGFRLVGENGADPHGFLDWYRAGLIAGTDPSHPERWPRPDELGQAKVEAASIALILGMTRRWLWATLSDAQQHNVIAWLATVIGQEYPPTNWLWFRVTVETFLASVGGPFSAADVRADLGLFESLYREHGWYSDGPERSFDYYCGWAMQFYPLIWAASARSAAFGADALEPDALEPVWRSRLSEFLDDYVTLIGSDGMPVLQGRSLIYRFAAAAPLWVGAATGATSISPGVLRRAASGILKAFMSRGSLDERGLLTLGLFGQWPAMAQSYSGSGSPYWAAKGMYGLALPASHPVWTAVEKPLPIERADVLRVIAAPGWVVSGTQSDGIARIVNHGTDHASLGDLTTDSPLYARFGYSSATMPPLVGATLLSPADNAVSVLDAAGRASHRTGFTPLGAGMIGAGGGGGGGGGGGAGAGWAASRADTHWVDVTDSGPDHGSGRRGNVTLGPTVTVASAIRGAWEVRVVRVERVAVAETAAGAAVPRVAPLAGYSATTPGAIADNWRRSDGRVRLRLSGWPLAGAHEGEPEASGGAASVRVGDLESVLTVVGTDAVASSDVVASTDAVAGVHTAEDVSPLGPDTAVPQVVLDVIPAEPVVALVGLGRMLPDAPTVLVRADRGGHAVDIRWPDGAESTLELPAADAGAGSDAVHSR